jgi:hypothetical protein
MPLSDEQIFEIADPFGAFEYGDAQGDKRRGFARAIESAAIDAFLARTGKYLTNDASREAAIADATAPLLAQIAAIEALSEKLKLEAQVHAQEARTANSTIAEIYKLCSGGTGEPGNWNGAGPVRLKLAQLEAKLAEARKADMFWNSDDADRPHGSIGCFLNDQICQHDLGVGAEFTIWRAKKLESVKIQVTAIDDEECEAEYEFIDAAIAQEQQNTEAQGRR